MKETLYFNIIDDLTDLITNPKLLFSHSEKSHNNLESALSGESIGTFEFTIADGSRIIIDYYEDTRDFYKIKINSDNHQVNFNIPHYTFCLGFEEHSDSGTGEVETEYDESDPRYLQGWIEFTPGDLRKVEIGNPMTTRYAFMSPIFSMHFEKFYFTKG